MKYQLINVNSEGKPLVHHWSNCVGAGRAKEGLRGNWQKQLETVVKECGFKYIRFHGLFHDDMCVYRIINGAEVFNFQYIDELFDKLLETGIRPFVEFGFMPEDMASGKVYQFWWKGNVTPPKSYEKWAELITKAAEHWIARYGLDEVKKWYFEVWNEPNLHGGFWTGTKSEYFKLYKVTATALKAVDPGLRVGGPATSNFVPDSRFDGEVEDKSKHSTFSYENIDDADFKPVWVEDFLKYCQENGLPVDFVSTHPYPTDFALDSHGKMGGRSRKAESTAEDLAKLKSIVRNSAYPNAEIHLTEWSSSPSSRDYSHDFNPAAAFIVKCNIESSGLADSLSYWTFTDIFEECGAGSAAFHGGFGLINYQGILKPSFYAYKFLNQLGKTELSRGDGYIVTKDEKVSILLYNYNSDQVKSAVPTADSIDKAEEIVSKGKCMPISLELEGLAPNAKFVVETVDQSSGCAMGAYKKLGCPAAPNHEETRILKEISQSTKKDILSADQNGRLKISLKLNPWAIALVKEI